MESHTSWVVQKGRCSGENLKFQRVRDECMSTVWGGNGNIKSFSRTILEDNFGILSFRVCKAKRVFFKCPWSPTGASYCLNLNQNQVVGYAAMGWSHATFRLHCAEQQATPHTFVLPIFRRLRNISKHRSILNSFHRRHLLPEKWILETEIMRLYISQFPTSHRAAVLCQNRMSGKSPESQARGLGRRSHRCPSNLQKASQLLGGKAAIHSRKKRERWTKTSQLRIRS